MISFETVKTALDKLAVYTQIENNFFLITRNKTIISRFNTVLANAIYSENEDLCTLDVYDLRYDKIFTIDTQRVMGMSYIGVPLSVSPDMFLFSEARHEFSPERLGNIQQDFLDKIKTERDTGCYGDEPVSKDNVCKATQICGFLNSEYGIDGSTHEFFNFLDPKYLYYNIVSNNTTCNKLIELQDTLLFSSSILSIKNIPCSSAEQRKEGIKQIMPAIIDGSIFNNLKNEWIAFLKTKINETVANYQQELAGIDSLYISEWRDFIYERMTESIDDIYCREVKRDGHISRENTDAIADFLYSNYEQCSIVMDHGDINLANCTDIIPPDIQQYLSGWGQNYIVWILRETYKHFTSMVSVQNQYKSLIDRLNNLNLDNELEPYNDHRLYLRFWPDGLDNDQFLHAHVRPFTSLEYNVIKSLVQDKIEFSIDDILKVNDDYVNAVVNNLEKYCDKVYERRLQQIADIASVRAQEIRDEIQPMYDELSAEEKIELDATLKSLEDMELYRSEIKSKGGIVNALSYWPVSLYPVPNNILKV